MIESVTKQIVELGLNMIVEGLGYYDELLRINKDMLKYWYIVKKDETTLISRLGSIKYHKTLFINKVTNERSYLLDRLMGLSAHTRLTENLVAKILSEAAEEI
jgi:hypothetical protein